MPTFLTSTGASWASASSPEWRECKRRKFSPRHRIRNYNAEHWGDLYRLSYSVAPRVALPVLGFTCWAAIVTSFYTFDRISVFRHIGIPRGTMVLTIVIGIAISLLLAFRLNNAYDRFWEGRKAWASIHFHTRNLSRLIWVFRFSTNELELEKRLAAMKVLISFSNAVKHKLRRENASKCICMGEYLQHLKTLSPTIHNTASKLPTPLQIARILQSYILEKPIIMTPCTTSVNGLIDAITILERIQSTPIPAAYAIHLKQCLVLFLAVLPFQIVPTTVGWFTLPIVGFASFVILGIEVIAVEIEDPFGYDGNDLPIDDYCNTTSNEILDIIKTHDSGADADGWILPYSLGTDRVSLKLVV